MSSEKKYHVTTEAVNEYTHRISLTILNLEPKDFTDYNCSARNTLGESYGNVKLYSKEHKFFLQQFFFYDSYG